MLRHATTDQQIETYLKAIGNNGDRRVKDKLQLLNIAMARYGKIGSITKCEATYEALMKLADKENSIEYKTKANLTMARTRRDQGRIEDSQMHLSAMEDLLKAHDLPALQNAYYLERSIYARDEGRYEDALTYSDKAIEVLIGTNLDRLLSNSYSLRGRIYRHLGQVDSAKVYYLLAKDIGEEYSLQEALPVILNNLGNISHIQGKYDEAIGYYIQSIEIKEKTNDIRGLAIGYHNIAAIKNDMQAYEEARIQFAKSDEYANKIDFKKIKAFNALKTGNSYQVQKQYKKALFHHTNALKISDTLNFQKVRLDALIGIGVDHTNLGNLEMANTVLLEALSLAESSGNKSAECTALVALADWYLQLDNSSYRESAKLSDSNIEVLLVRAMQLSKQMDYGEKKMLVYDGLNKLYTKTGDNTKRAALLSEYIVLKDSLFAKNRSDAVAEWETKYATAEKEKEIIQLEANNKLSQLRTRSWQWALGVTTLLLGLLGFIGFKYQKRKNAQRQMEQAEMFRSKLSSDLHDDVGTMLSSIAMQSEVMGLRAEPEQVEKFENLSNLSREAMSRMRDTVWAIDSRKDKVEDLLDRMKDYLSDLMNGHRLTIRFQHDIVDDSSKLRPDVRQNLYLIFKEAVNNAAKYSNGNQLTILFAQSKSIVTLSIHDNGHVDPSSIKTSGTGLSNMKMRATKIGGSFHLNTDNGFAIEINIPI